jgi:hypothetical protein
VSLELRRRVRRSAAGDEEVDWADDFESEEQMDQFDDDEAFQCDDAGTYADDP